MLDHLTTATGQEISLTAIAEENWEAWLAKAPARMRTWLTSTGFEGKAGAHAVLPDTAGRPADALIVHTGGPAAFRDFATLPAALPKGAYRLKGAGAELAQTAAFGWALGGYSYENYKADAKSPARLVWPDAADRNRIAAQIDGIFLARDLINTPANDMGPAELADAADALARRLGAAIDVITGEDLLKANHPLIYAVGKGSARQPRLIDLTWGAPDAPKVTLVGKGVCFDTGGYDLKTSSFMRLMKKDMGGAANVLGLAAMIMGAGLKVRLRVLIPAVENAVSGNAMRPGDVYPSRAGLTVEIGNTDAEGRLVLADALRLAGEERPDLLVDFATLTGAARVALGLDLPALFARNEALAADLLAAGRKVADPLWQLPLWAGYRDMLDSRIADLSNAPNAPYGGAITAALFLDRFVDPEVIGWMHIDLMAWNVSTRPGRPEGGEAQGIRALFQMLADRYE